MFGKICTDVKFLCNKVGVLCSTQVVYCIFVGCDEIIFNHMTDV